MNKSKAAIGTNGSVTDLDIDSLMSRSFKTAAEVQQSVEPPTTPVIAETMSDATIAPRITAEELMADLAAIEGDDGTLKDWALDHVDALAALDLAEVGKVFNALNQRGISENWLRRELKPAINDSKQAVVGSANISWRDYVAAAESLDFTFRLNVLNDTVEVNGERMSDVTEAKILSHLYDRGFKNAEIARRAFITKADECRHHPVKGYLQSLKWDGADHIAQLAGYFSDNHAPIRYADGSTRRVFHAWLRKWLIGGVGKVFDPRNIQNFMLILDGAQGKGKSYFTKWLCPLADLHMESAIKTEDKDFMGYLSTKWIWEVGELGATLRKADREALKAFITQVDVTYRPPFGRYAISKPALASFIGTVNMDGGLLNDPTGYRRFCPVELLDIDWAYVKRVDVNQVWAQAYALYCSKESWRLSTEEKATHAEIVQNYEVEDVLSGHVQEWFVIEPDNHDRYTPTTKIIDRLRTFAGVRTEDRKLAMQLSSTLQKLGLTKAKKENRWGYYGISITSE